MGAPREASGWAHEALNSRGIHSPLDGLTELWRIAYPRPFRQTVERHAGAHGVDARLAWAVMRIESRYATMARSHAGASGLLQVMPGTARWLASMRMEPTRDIDLYDPTRNIELGVDLLGRLRDRFEGDVPVMLVAYNAGSGRTQRWQRKVRAKSLARWVDRLPIAQAKNYVRSVVSAWALYRYLDGQPTDLATPAPAAGTVAQNR
jgi:soluble lytic murein transglycosylase